MHLDSVLAQRLAVQHLTGPPCPTVEDAVRDLVCVQAQDAPLARWSLAMRTGQVRDADIRATVDTGRVVRTHVLRPTWHYVLAEDLRWLLALTGPKVISAMAAQRRRLGLDDPAVVAREHERLGDTLRGGRFRTRRELTRDDLRGERLSILLMLAELEGLVCSGPLAAGVHTYALVDERVPETPAKDREVAIRDLVRRFFTGHGPASVAHLMRWTKVTKREVTAALAQLGDVLTATTVDGVELWHPVVTQAAPTGGTWLFPVFDEVYLPYPGSTFPRVADHPWGERDQHFAEAGGGVIVSDLQEIGWWKRTDARRTTVTVGLSPTLDGAHRRAVEEQAEALAAFTGRELELVLAAA